MILKNNRTANGVPVAVWLRPYSHPRVVALVVAVCATIVASRADERGQDDPLRLSWEFAGGLSTEWVKKPSRATKWRAKGDVDAILTAIEQAGHGELDFPTADGG